METLNGFADIVERFSASCWRQFLMNFEFVFWTKTNSKIYDIQSSLSSFPVKTNWIHIYVIIWEFGPDSLVFGIEISAGCLLYISSRVYFCWFLIVEWWYSTVELQITVKSRFFEKFFENLEWFWARKICLVYSLKINYHNSNKNIQWRFTH